MFAMLCFQRKTGRTGADLLFCDSQVREADGISLAPCVARAERGGVVHLMTGAFGTRGMIGGFAANARRRRLALPFCSTHATPEPGTRVSLGAVVCAFNRGEVTAEIQDSFDTMSLADVYAAISYYLHNRAKVDAHFEWQSILFYKLKAENEESFEPKLAGEMLLTRLNGEDPNWPR